MFEIEFLSIYKEVEFCSMTDILLDETGELSFKNGDLQLGLSDNQHQEHILIANKGKYKKFPEIVVGINQMINENDYLSEVVEKKKNLKHNTKTSGQQRYNSLPKQLFFICWKTCIKKPGWIMFVLQAVWHKTVWPTEKYYSVLLLKISIYPAPGMMPVFRWGQRYSHSTYH